MDKLHKRLAVSGLMLLGLPFLAIPSAFAAKPINLRHQNLSVLSAVVAGPQSGMETHEISRNVGVNNTTHVRIQQTYQGYKVWGADAVVHIPNSSKVSKNVALKNLLGSSHASMNGTLYQGIASDLANTHQNLLTTTQANHAMQQAVTNYEKKVGATVNVSDKKMERVVFVDKSNKAHWAYLVSFHADAIKAGALPAKPNFIMDAETLKVYAEWNNIKTLDEESGDLISGGGNGGNKKMGKLSYDSLEGDLHYAKLSLTRDDASKTCWMKNPDVIVKSYRSGKTMSFRCTKPSKNHGDLFWNGDQDKVNDGYSPMNDALFGGSVIKGMYREWYNVPVLTESDGTPMILTMIVHDPIDNAYWDGRNMTFGDGVDMFYPLTSLGVAAHEISHGFTEQHAGLAYYEQSGGMNEAFSDMAAQAAEFYAYAKNSWQIGPEIFKAPDEALRYMDKPSKDCGNGKPGNWCSIDDAGQYYDGLDVHFSSGVYNRAFYLMGTAEGWSTRKAFDVMVLANQNYWTSGTTFAEGACGVLSAANDLGYDPTAIKAAFAAVKVDTSQC